ncbi:N-acetyltransferase [Macrococcus caseolyticus]|uniref:GNAT family N-acetyltransferase n=1 Tax=Macrococcoides caseolyticum TaxID=69966 RepID=UPI001642EE71|nr:N-acetyltransferase [Macrococcus caseolyticus]MDJ1089676.1 N-acetyltransferase [Macrococcus caseolyticus]MDJ1091959.1 N-acetyltransferase [Macrococcus caseolyticus]MDJ1153949.1 N-acetyltransferase [Macrococcus caseolyticus]MEB8172119.1 N-acetyltransferase [Macrococcus caseolyticus]
MIEIRTATNEEYKEIQEVVQLAFKNEEMSDQNEHNLVIKIKDSDAYIAELSLVAIESGKIVGHIMMSRITINNDEEHIESLALAPVSVLPDFQNLGIGSMLIKKLIGIAEQLEFTSIIVLGHDTYYPKFGFEEAEKYNIYPPFEVPSQYFMVKFLTDDVSGINGKVQYSKAFE